MDSIETWGKISGFEGYYEVSSKGRIKSLNYKRSGNEGIIKNRKHTNGYLYVTLCKDSVQKNFRIHRLVAERYINNSNNLCCVNHIDGNKSNNNVENLEWVSASENQIHSIKSGLRKSRTGFKYRRLKEDEVLRIFRENNTQEMLAEKYNISRQSVCDIKNGRTWRRVLRDA